MRAQRLILVAVTVLTLAGCTTAKPLAPGQLFAGPLLNIRAPDSAGWQIVESSAGNLTFGRRDATTGNTYIALVSAFELEPFSTPAEFLAIIKTRAEQDSPPDRFRPIETDYRLTSERPYPCVRFRGTVEDLKARTPRGTAALPFHLRSLYCQHPTRPTLGTLTSYSQRGGPPDPDLDARAQSFMDGVEAVRDR
jgi:hypothetical protein